MEEGIEHLKGLVKSKIKKNRTILINKILKTMGRKGIEHLKGLVKNKIKKNRTILNNNNLKRQKTMGRKGTKKIQEGLGLPNIFRKTFTLCNKKTNFIKKFNSITEDFFH